MVETFKTLKGFNRVDRDNWFKFRNDGMRATRSTVSVTDNIQQEREDVLFLESIRLDTRKNFFTFRAVNKWNQIPENVKQKKSINAFKNSYDEWRKQQQQQT